MKPDHPASCSRRGFLGSASAAVAGTLTGAVAADPAFSQADQTDTHAAPLRFDSPPVLQNPRADRITVVWAVSRRALGWVEFGETKELSTRAESVMHGLRQTGRRVLSVNIGDLKPATTYFYRVAAAAVDFNANLTWNRGPVEYSGIHEFKTPSADAREVTFVVINDTHTNAETVPQLFASLLENQADYTIWNGDLGIDIQPPEAGDDEVLAHLIRDVLRPGGPAYAVSKPLLFVPGNHDVRGPGAHLLSQVLTPWDGSPLGRNFVLRHGPLAMLALDTGEDKPDSHPYLAGVGAFEAYRVAQRKWLEQAVALAEFREAPCKIALTHIPLHGAGSCGHSRDQWSGILSAAGVQLVISGHVHAHRYDPPCAQHRFGQLVGGGPLPQEATTIRGHATREGLTISLRDLSGKEIMAQSFPAPRV
jgi:predicted phosphodiesterase